MNKSYHIWCNCIHTHGKKILFFLCLPIVKTYTHTHTVETATDVLNNGLSGSQQQVETHLDSQGINTFYCDNN